MLIVSLAANILIHEEGRLEICDFGVAGILQSQRDKRSTWIGTPHWMPPEMFATRGEAPKYGSEVCWTARSWYLRRSDKISQIDVWAYGCTLFEFATGNPPNSGLRERVQIGRQLNRSTPKLDSGSYSQGLKDLIALALDSDPTTRPSMADILAHPYIANTEEQYPTASVSELVRDYYQWSQRGGQRISLFHPGGAAAAEMPGTDDSDDDWNFSTTDGFERRFSVIDLDQLAASLAEMEEASSPSTPIAERNSEDSAETDMDQQQKANFDERVRRGAEAMEGLFNEEKPSYKYETKNDFVPVQPAEPASDLPLRTETDRSSVLSTFIDIDIGSFDSSHYAAGVPSAQPFQLADADTIRANRSSLRLNRTPEENTSQPISIGLDGSDSQDQPFQAPSGPRPPTMDWKFPVFVQPEDAGAESAKPESVKAESVKTDSENAESDDGEYATPPGELQEETPQEDKRATMEWTFPVMSSSASDNARSSTTGSVVTAVTATRDSIHGLSSDLGKQGTDERGDARPSTSASNRSEISESDYDPFRFDRPETPPAPLYQASSFGSDPPSLADSWDDDPSRPGLLDGPGPDEEHPLWRDNTEVFDPNNIPPMPAMPVRDGPGDSPVVSSEPGSPIYESLQTARRDRAPYGTVVGENGISFPRIIPPNWLSMMEDADDDTVVAELDRLLGDFLGGLSATSDALSKQQPEQREHDDDTAPGATQ